MEQTNTSNTNNQIQISFLAIDQFVEDNIIRPVEKEIKPGEMVYWGQDNSYPNYIEDLYLNVPTFKTIIDGCVDYICGNKIINNSPLKVNKRGQNMTDIVKGISKDLVKFGGFALNVIKNQLGQVIEIYYIDFKKIRTNKENTKFYYTENWNKSYGRLKTTEIKNFYSDSNSTIYYYKNDVNYVYPIAPINAAVKSCEMERMITDYHYNNIVNGFNSSFIVNFNGGKPTDEQKSEIERNFYNKFMGPANASRPMLSFNNGKVQETTVTKIDKDDLDQKYTSLTDRTRQDIFTAFRCSPVLFGIEKENIGFNNQEYTEAYKLFNRTFIQPRQEVIKETFNTILGMDNAITIVPFSLDLIEE